MKIHSHRYGLPNHYDMYLINEDDYARMKRTQVWIFEDTNIGSTQYGYGFWMDVGLWRYIPSFGPIVDFLTKKGMIRYIRKIYRYTGEMRRKGHYNWSRHGDRFERLLNLSGAQVVRAGLSNPVYRARWRALRSPFVVRFPENRLHTDEFTAWCVERDIVLHNLPYGRDGDTVVHAMVLDCPSPEIAFEAKMRWA